MTHTAPTIDINIQYARWLEVLPSIEARIQKAASAVCQITELDHYARHIEISVMLCDDLSIQELNQQYRDKNTPTNVLSFPQEELTAGDYADLEGETVMLGDVVMSLDTLEHECEEQNKRIEHHATHLFVHGLLHLLGYDHGSDKDAAAMETLEVDILDAFGIENPYE